nr:unnamed protein product [Callosobruchus analis]CAI5825352.1 unnamed protein product [Callosobruchus analis]CAI5838332.1 unnamed protein product [Callosobruchus analis]CAI5839167.1 unnamed protein product [Callosobruchus analis]CAI5843002.1 unnamed protein product [Callosobruchus analis]
MLPELPPKQKPLLIMYW